MVAGAPWKDSMKIRNQTRWGGAVKRERVTRWRCWVSSMDQKRSREITYECCNYCNSGGPWQKQREMVKPSNDLDWIHFLCWALLSSAMCNVWENRLIFMILLVKLQRSHDEKTDSVISLFCFNWATNSFQTNLMQIKAFKDFSSIRYQFLFLEMQSTLFTNLIYTIR